MIAKALGHNSKFIPATGVSLRRPTLHSEGAWQKIDVYLRPADSYPGAEISCRFWGARRRSTGRALFRDMRFVKIAGVPPPTAP